MGAMGEAFAGVPEGAPIPEAALMKLSQLVAERYTAQLFRLEKTRPAPELKARLAPPVVDEDRPWPANGVTPFQKDCDAIAAMRLDVCQCSRRR